VSRRLPRDEIDDVVSAVFLAAWRRRASLPDNALPWLYRTARNLIGNRYRSRDRSFSLAERLRTSRPEPPADPAEVTTDRQRMLDCFDKLSEEDKELLLLAAWEGLSTNEIATVMDVTANTAAVRLHRARKRLEEASASAEDEHRATEPALATDDRRIQ